MPAPGEIANISLNTIADVNPCPQRPCVWSGGEGQAGVFDWCGGGFVPRVRGGFATQWGGGHHAYYGNEVYGFPLDTRLWECMNAPYPANDATPINDWGEHVGPTNPGDPVEPAAAHTYRQVLGLPPELGGGPQGSTIQMHLSAIGRASIGRSGAHLFSHADRRWRRWGDTQPPREAGSLAYMPFALDRSRRCVWGMGSVGLSSHGARVVRFDLESNKWTVHSTPLSALPFPYFSGAGYTGLEYCPALDVLVAVEVYKGRPPASGTNPIVCTLSCSNHGEGWRPRETRGFNRQLSTAYSINWADFLGALVIYCAQAQNVVHYLKPPSRVDGTWNFSAETFSGAAPAWEAPKMAACYNRMQPVDDLGCLLWYHGVRSPVQLWRPRMAL